MNQNPKLRISKKEQDVLREKAIQEYNTYCRSRGEEYYAIPDLSERHKKYAAIHTLLERAKSNDDLKALAQAVQMCLGEEPFKAWYSSLPGVPKSLSTSQELWICITKYLYSVLYNRDYPGAAILMWGPDVFDPRPRSSRLIFDALGKDGRVNVMGCGSSSKTYSGAVWMLLDWLLDPCWTKVLLVGPTLAHLQQNAFGDIKRLHQQSAIPLPGKSDARTLCVEDQKGLGFGFYTIALSMGELDSAKLKGHKVKTRPQEHPLFGMGSRLRLLVDEAQDVPTNLWGQIFNVLANKNDDSFGDGVDENERLKIFAAANPSQQYSFYGKNCEPQGGWNSINGVVEKWTGETGWTVLRLNAMLSENVRSRRTLFPNLQTYTGVKSIIQGNGGDDQAEKVYTQVYGMFPPTGSKAAVIKPTHVELSRGEWIFSGPTTAYMTFDPAYTGDRPAVASGRYGMAGAWMDYDGVIHKLKTEMPAIQVDSVGVLARGDTQDMADEIFVTAKSLGVSAECFGIDRTGIGQGCHDIIRRQWHKAVHGRNVPEPADILGICYSERASETKVLEEDTDVPCNMYDNTASELWYAAGKLFERGVIKMGKGVDKLAFDELVGRRGGRVSGKARKLSVESKDAYKARGNSSPDFADAVTMLIHTVRVREDFAPKADKTPEAREEVVDNWTPVNVWDGVGDVGGLGTVSVDMSRLLDNRD